jgi:hypothetical protein
MEEEFILVLFRIENKRGIVKNSNNVFLILFLEDEKGQTAFCFEVSQIAVSSHHFASAERPHTDGDLDGNFRHFQQFLSTLI